MEDALRNEELILKKVLYHFRLSPDSRMIKALKKEMALFAEWEKRRKHSSLNDEEKINAFRSERAGNSTAAHDVNFPAAAAQAYLIASGRKTMRHLIPEKRRLTPLDLARVESEGIWKDDPPELKRYFALYEKYRKERDRWNIPIPDRLFKKLIMLSGSGEIDKYLDELSNLIASWMKNQPPKTLSELLKPDKDRMESLKRMAKPREEGGLEIPFPKKYPFGVYFLTVNVLSRLYGLRPEIMDAILTKTSKIYRRAKQRQSTGEGVEILAGQVEKYEDVIKHISHTAAKEIENLEWYLNTSFKHRYFEGEGQRQEILFTDLVSAENQGRESEKIDKIISQTIYFQEHTHLADEAIFAKEKEMELRDFGKKFRLILKSLPQRKRELIMLRGNGSTIEEAAAKLRVSSRTIKRDLSELRSDFKTLYGKYKGN
jgi:hypothetical protein